MSQPKHDPYAVLRLPEFRFYVSARLMLTIALQIQAVVVGLQIYSLNHDPLALGLIGLAEVVPALTVSLYAGHISDRMNRKYIVLTCMAVMLLCAGALLYFSLPSTHNISTYPIYGIIFISGIARGFFNPAFYSFFMQLIPQGLSSNATTWSSTTWHIGAVGGPAIGGLLYGFIGLSSAYIVDLSLIIGALICLMQIASKPTPVQLEKEGIIKSLGVGFRFVFSQQIILAALSLDLFSVLFGGAEAMLPIFCDKILHVGAEGLGILRASPAVGAILMAFYMAHFPPMKRAGRNVMLAAAGFGLSMLLFGISTNFWISLGILLISGAFDNVSVVVRGTIIQTMTPDNMRGRVSAVNSMFIGSSNELGAFESGVTAKMFGLVRSVVIGGLMTMGVVGTVAASAPKLRKLNLEGK